MSVQMIGILGDVGTGKSTLWFKFAHDMNKPDSVMGFGDSKMREIEVHGEKIETMLHYGSNLERFGSTIEATAKELVSKSYKHCKGFILLYDVTNRISFDHVKAWKNALAKALMASEELVPSKILLLGNKTDKADERVISTEEGKELAHDIGSLFAEASSTTGENVMDAIKSLVSAMLAAEL
jgi:Ras-related protein Rab-1A